ncbi:hypothetical protein HZ326_25373 [Fusarium oxysporum f. sp. albedinis]|nr:hypothetical protein HZ326_25373 [Fusarium oxysporum f. sp. albedinis]
MESEFGFLLPLARHLIAPCLLYQSEAEIPHTARVTNNTFQIFITKNIRADLQYVSKPMELSSGMIVPP